MPNLALILDHSLKSLAANDALAKLVGFQRGEDLIGTTDYDVKSKSVELSDIFIAQDKEVLKGHTLKTLDICEYHDGKTHMVLTTKSPLRSSSGDIIGVSSSGAIINQADLTVLFTKLNKFSSIQNPILPQNSFLLDGIKDEYSLTQREREVLFYLCRGQTSKMIARHLALSPRTIEDYIDKLKIKMGCQTKSELQDFAVNKGFLHYVPTELLCKNDFKKTV